MKKTKSCRSRKQVCAGGARVGANFHYSKRHLALAIPLLFAIGAGESHAVSCALDGTVVDGAATNSVLCNNAGTLTVTTFGELTNTGTGILNNSGMVVNNGLLTNNGLITNSGSIISAGSLIGSGTLNSTGIVMVTSGTVAIANSGNLANGTLTGGTWVVDGSGSNKSKTSLAIGSGNIATNNANIALIGLGATFSQLTNLAANNGSLVIRDGAKFTSAALDNTGTLMVASGGTANIKSAGNLSNGTLTGGIWIVDNTGGTSTLAVGSGAITTNDATVALIGANALSSFSQMSGLAKNTGSLIIGGGADLGSKMSLYNTGTLTVASGSSVELQGSKNLSNGTLTGGNWVVDGRSVGASLVIGKNDITTNNANITLIGANADFSQISALANNQGTLTIGEGASYATSAALNNTGTIVTAAGGTLNVTNTKQLPLTNDGTITNSGSIVVATKMSGSGTLDNAGTLTVLSGANVQIAKSSNFAAGTLTGGTWVVDGSGGSKTASLAIGSGDITTNDANIELIGANASFSQLAGLTTNNGRLAVNGANFTSTSLTNTGTVAVTSGTMTIAKSSNLANGTLTGGTWVVDGSGNSKSKTSLAIGSGNIATNDANVELIGLGATFSQLTNLATNNGSLAIRDGAGFTSAALHNTGTLTVASGGTVDIKSSSNLSNGTLTGGTWVVDNTFGASKLAIGSGAITTNNADIVLIGAETTSSSSFSQLGGLANNTGSLTVGAGADLGSKMSLYNTGTLTVASGGSVALQGSKNLSNGTLTGGNWVVDASEGKVASLVIGKNAITTNNANITLIGANADFSQISALANNQGTLTIGAGANYATSAALNNTGTIVTAAGGTLSLTNDKKLGLTNKGSMTSAGRINGNGTSKFNNAGALTIESTGAVSGFTDFVQTSGVTTLKNGGLLSATNVQFLGGMLTGSGTVDPPNPIVIGANATVAPTGVLTLEGNTEFDGMLAIGILGASDYGILNVLGSIDFGAGAQISFGFDPDFNLADPFYAFKFLFADDIQGLQNLTFDFSGLDPLYTTELDLECQGGRCDYSLLLTRHDDPGRIPEPGTLLLVALGLLGFAFGRRKAFPRRF